jgi:hypothetical protein
VKKAERQAERGGGRQGDRRPMPGEGMRLSCDGEWEMQAAFDRCSGRGQHFAVSARFRGHEFARTQLPSRRADSLKSADLPNVKMRGLYLSGGRCSAGCGAFSRCLRSNLSSRAITTSTQKIAPSMNRVMGQPTAKRCYHPSGPSLERGGLLAAVPRGHSKPQVGTASKPPVFRRGS